MIPLTLNKAMEVLGFAVDDSMSLLSEDVRDSAKLVLKELRDQLAARSIPEMMQELHETQRVPHVEILWDLDDVELNVIRGFGVMLEHAESWGEVGAWKDTSVDRVLHYLVGRYQRGPF